MTARILTIVFALLLFSRCKSNFYPAHMTKETETGRYHVNFDKMTEAMNDLSELILTLQGNGDYDRVANLVAENGIIKPELQSDLDRIAQTVIPVDIVFEQGADILGLV
ncbi:MAG: hypothetical protein OEY56_02105 [Cyclobacteriaceae bacterium]|nr:hypothetical protein [Cyclobacteriaceae bacterium]